MVSNNLIVTVTLKITHQIFTKPKFKIENLVQQSRKILEFSGSWRWHIKLK